MPYFTLNRNYALSTTKGHSVNFKKGEKTWVPQAIIAEALACGAIPTEPLNVLPPEENAPPTLSDKERKEKVFAVFEKLVLRAGRGDFSANGQPRANKVAELLGFELTTAEQESMWREYFAAKGEDKDK